MIKKHLQVDSIFDIEAKTLLHLSDSIPHGKTTAADLQDYESSRRENTPFSYEKLLDVMCSTLLNFFTHKVGQNEGQHKELYGALKDQSSYSADGKTSMIGILKQNSSWKRNNREYVMP